MSDQPKDLPASMLQPVTFHGEDDGERLRKVNADAGKLITRLKQEVGEKDRAIARVHEVHYPITHAGKQYCVACSSGGLELMPYPCRTIRALAEPEGDRP